jgi:MGT family glycosyltransferase
VSADAPPAQTRFSVIEGMKLHARRVLAGGMDAVAAAGVEALIVDECDVAGGSIADACQLPFVTLCTSPPLYLDSSVPAPYFGTLPGGGPLDRLRAGATNAIVRARFAPLLGMVNAWRAIHGLRPLRQVNDLYSRVAMIAQLPEALEFPVRRRPPQLTYVGPLVDAAARRRTAFAWDRLDGRPLIYATLGTLMDQRRDLYRVIADACGCSDWQAILSLGGTRLMPADLGPLPANVLCVHYAPQLELLPYASLTLTHGGLNTVVEALAAGVPVLAMPINNDQPGIAARLRAAGAGQVLPARRATACRLRNTIETMLGDPGCRAAAARFREPLLRSPGLDVAADIVESTLVRQVPCDVPPPVLKSAGAGR